MEGVTMEDMFTFNFFVWVVVFGAIVGIIAHCKGKDAMPWFLYGALLFIVALPHVLVTKPNQKALDERKIKNGEKKRCPFCDELINVNAKICHFCKKELVQNE